MGSSTPAQSLVCTLACVYSTRMRVQIYLPDEVASSLKTKDVNVSRICREALLVALEVCPTCQRPYEKEKPLPAPVRATSGRRVVRGERTGRIGGVTRRRGQ